MSNPVANLILRGRVYFGNALVAGYDIRHISIIETYKGLQELHLHGWCKSEEWDDELKVAYQKESDGIDPIEEIDAVARQVNYRPIVIDKRAVSIPPKPPSIAVMVNILRLKEGTWNEKKEDYDWKNLDRRVRFNGRITQVHNGHIVMKPIEEGLTAEMLAQAMAVVPLMQNKSAQVFVNEQTLKDIGLMN